MPTCPACSSVFPRASSRCPACGAASNRPATPCPGCGEPLDVEAPGCAVCGRLREPANCDDHPDRAALVQCVVCGRPLCEACARPADGAHLCREHAGVPIVDGWAQVYTTSDDLPAQLIRENLQAEGIDAQVLSQKDHFSFTVGLGNLSPVRVLVPAFAFEEARTILADHTDESGEVRFACTACGETYDAGETICSNCGRPLR